MALLYSSMASWYLLARKAVLPFSFSDSASCTGSTASTSGALEGSAGDVGGDWPEFIINVFCIQIKN